MTPPLQVLALGRFVPKKGFDVLIRACKILDELGADFRLTLGGSGPCGKQLQALRRIFALEGKISFPGFIRYDRVSQFLDSGDIFVMPSVVDPTSDRDGIPNVILEALLHRVPVVATDVCGIGEVIRDGETGLLVPEKDPLALAKAVLKLIDDRKSALEMAEKGRSLVLQEFDLDQSCLAMLRLFREHLQRTPPP